MPMNDARHKIVYFADKSLHIVPEDKYRAADFADERTRAWNDSDGELSTANIIKFFERYDRAVFVTSECGNEAFAKLASHFKPVRAAGGIVADSDGEVVMIRRNDRWDLPKGHIEAGESPEALRSVGTQNDVLVSACDRLPLGADASAQRGHRTRRVVRRADDGAQPAKRLSDDPQGVRRI